MTYINISIVSYKEEKFTDKIPVYSPYNQILASLHDLYQVVFLYIFESGFRARGRIFLMKREALLQSG